MWPLSEVGTQVGALMLKSSPPHNSDIPYQSRDQNTHTFGGTVMMKISLKFVIYQKGFIYERVGALMLKSSPPHNLDMPSQSRDHNTPTFGGTVMMTISIKFVINQKGFIYERVTKNKNKKVK